MELSHHVLSTLPSFVLYFLFSLTLAAAFVVIFIHVTPHREMELICAGNTAASIKLGGALLGFALPLASVVLHSVSYVDLLVWSGVALVAQLLAYAVMRLVVPGLTSAIEGDRVGVAVWSAAVSLTVGLLNAACLSW